MRCSYSCFSLCVCWGVGGSPQTDLPQGQMDSLLSIISSQRERYRLRNQELEAVSAHHCNDSCCSEEERLNVSCCWCPSDEQLPTADLTGSSERAGQSAGRQHQALREDQVSAELPKQSKSFDISLLWMMNKPGHFSTKVKWSVAPVGPRGVR